MGDLCGGPAKLEDHHEEEVVDEARRGARVRAAQTVSIKVRLQFLLHGHLQGRQGRKMKGKETATQMEPSRCQLFLRPYLVAKVLVMEVRNKGITSHGHFKPSYPYSCWFIKPTLHRPAGRGPPCRRRDPPGWWRLRPPAGPSAAPAPRPPN